MFLGPAVLRAAFGACEREVRPLSFPIFLELEEFLREVKAIWFHKVVFIFCQNKM